MSVLWMDSGLMHADVDTATNALRKWTTNSGGGYYYDATGGPFGGGVWRVNNRGGHLGIHGDWNVTTIYVAAWIYQVQSQDGWDFLSFWEGNRATEHVVLQHDAVVGGLNIQRGPTTLDTVGGLWKEDTWHHFACKIVMSDTVGQVVIEVDGVEVYDSTATLDTINGGTNGWIDSVSFWGVDNGMYWSMPVIWSTAGNPPTDFFNCHRIYALRPNADTAQEDFTPQGAGDQFAEIDEVNTDDDSTYNESSTATDADELDCESIATNVGTIYAVQATVVARKDDAGARGIKVGVDSNGTDDVSADIPLLTTYAFYDHILDLNPDDSLAWEEADINAAKLRYEVGS